MKAVFCTAYGSPDVLKVRETVMPNPKDNELLIKVHAASITTADTMMRSGTPRFARLFLGWGKPKHPIMGTGFAGTVVKVGKEVKGFEKGDPVFGETGITFGANAEYVCVPADGIVLPMPHYLSFEEAAVMCDGPLTSMNFLKDIADIEAGTKVLINGASGSLGVAAIQIAKHSGAEVTAVCSTANIDLVKSLGADHVIDYTENEFTEGDLEYDVVYDTVGKSCYGKAAKVLKKSGVYMSPVLNYKILIPMLTNRLRKGPKAKFDATGLNKPWELKAKLKKLLLMMAEGKYNAVIERRYAMEQIADAHGYIDTGRKRGNVVLSVANA